MKFFNNTLPIIVATLFIAACQSTPSHTLTFTPPASNAIFNNANQAAVVNVTTRDARSQSEISSYVRDGQLFKLSASPDVTALFQQIVQQDLNSKGFRVGAPSASNTNVIVNVKDFYAKVDQGNLRYKIDAKIQVEINVQGAKGNFSKNIGSTRTTEGAFNANNDEIQNVLTATFNEVVKAIYADQEISSAIRQYSN